MKTQRTLNTCLCRRALALTAFVSVAAMVHGGAAARASQVTAAAAVFALAAIAAVLRGSVAIWRPASSSDQAVNGGASHGALAHHAGLAAVAYGWGALAMQGLYWTPLTGLKWQHGWQYAAAMALLATGSALLSRTLRRTLPAAETAVANNHVRLAVPAAVSQGLIAAGGLAALIVSGKLWSVRADWAANRVFAGLAVAILAISVATVVTGLRSRQAG